jgi:formylglycine-generating enzyme required for sulfatase activity
VPSIVTRLDDIQDGTPAGIKGNAQDIVRQFRATASPMARRLAGLMAAAPVNLRVIELIQETLLPESQQMHVAEVFLGGLLEQCKNAEGKSWFQFRRGVRQELRASLSKTETVRVLNKVSAYITQRLGLPLRSFSAFLMAEDLLEEVQEDEQVMAFAEVALDSLRQMGGQYAVFAEQVSARPPTGLKTFEFEVAEYVEETALSIEFQTFEFDVLTLWQGEEDEQDTTPDPLAELNWTRILFTVATLDRQNHTSTHQAAAWEYSESIGFRRTLGLAGGAISLKMIAVPGGQFQMGSDMNPNEQPIHLAEVQPFFIGKYPITQIQWKAISKLPEVHRSLQSTPFRVEGDDRPIEGVSWDDAIEFCARLSKHTGRQYRLPTEAEWEYACRAGTTTQYYFGDEMLNELANYYSRAHSGTTPVGEFTYANAFGLYDMHGNIWEWCVDHWHENYERAPVDGSAWIDESTPGNAKRVLRGGSWIWDMRDCRSTSRIGRRASFRYHLIGFRVISPTRIL